MTAVAAGRAVLALPGRLGVGLLVALIKAYQFVVSPLLGDVCRFRPSCSCYMIEALRKYGLIVGLAKGLRRIARCHPWNPGGYDPP